MDSVYCCRCCPLYREKWEGVGNGSIDYYFWARLNNQNKYYMAFHLVVSNCSLIYMSGVLSWGQVLFRIQTVDVSVTLQDHWFKLGKCVFERLKLAPKLGLHCHKKSLSFFLTRGSYRGGGGGSVARFTNRKNKRITDHGYHGFHHGWNSRITKNERSRITKNNLLNSRFTENKIS